MTSTLDALQETRTVSRRRRELELAVLDARENLADQQRRIAQLAALLVDPNDSGVETRLAAERNRLKELQTALQKAEMDFNEFAQACPTQEELQRREEALKRKAEEEKKSEHRARFASNLTRQLALLTEYAQLEINARELSGIDREYQMSERNPAAAAGIEAGLVSPFPFGTFPLKGPGIAPGSSVYDTFVGSANAWLTKWGFAPVKGFDSFK